MNFLHLAEKEYDRHIYRIMKEEDVFSSFAESQNVLCQAHKWKDKFENLQLALGGVLDGATFEYGFKNGFVGQCWTRHSLSEAMWGIYASNAEQRYLRIRSTPRKLLAALIAAHPEMPQDTCFVGGVRYKSEATLRSYLENNEQLPVSAIRFAEPLLLKRRAFRHESEIRLLYFGDAKNCDASGLYRYKVDPHKMITQIMADPNRDRRNWRSERAAIRAATGFVGNIKRSKIYDPPEWNLPVYKS